MNLYQISEAYFAKVQMLNEIEDLTPEIINDTLMDDSIECAKAIGALAKNLEAEIEAMKEYEVRMFQKRSALEKRHNNLKSYLLQSMLLTGQHKIPSPEFNISVKKNQDSLHIDSMTRVEDLPEDLVNTKTEITPDKVKIKERLKAGEEIKGCSLKPSYRVEIK